MPTPPRNTMKDLNRLLERQNFDTKEEMMTFLNGLIGKQVPELGAEELTDVEKAQDLVAEAYELSVAKGKKKIEQALKLNPDCIEAYEYLTTVQTTPLGAIEMLEKAIEIGRRIFGGAFLEEHRGHFWGIHETRPYMRCLQMYAQFAYAVEDVDVSIALYEEMIELNPDDNLGVRDQLLLYLLEVRDIEKFVMYSEKYKEDGSVATFLTRALFSFVVLGEHDETNELLKVCTKLNKFVAKKLIAKNPAERDIDGYSPGDENEADYYVSYAHHVWHQTPGAIAWLKKVVGRS